MIRDLRSNSAKVRERLAAHPGIAGPIGVGPDPLTWIQNNAWERSIRFGTFEEGGLAELADNNPWVCADRVGLPQGIDALALVALGPLARGGVLMERPAIIASEAFDADRLAEWFLREGWDGGATVTLAESPAPGTVALTLMVPLPAEVDARSLADLYEERFGRAYFVRRSEGPLNSSRVLGNPQAEFVTEWQDGLAVIRTVADSDGKGGADGVVHAFNVMVGFEETSGLA